METQIPTDAEMKAATACRNFDELVQATLQTGYIPTLRTDWDDEQLNATIRKIRSAYDATMRDLGRSERAYPYLVRLVAIP